MGKWGGGDECSAGYAVYPYFLSLVPPTAAPI